MKRFAKNLDGWMGGVRFDVLKSTHVDSVTTLTISSCIFLSWWLEQDYTFEGPFVIIIQWVLEGMNYKFKYYPKDAAINMQIIILLSFYGNSKVTNYCKNL